MKNINWPGLLVCAICVAASLAFAVMYGLSASELWWLALIYASAGVASVIVEMLSAHRIAHLRREKRRVAMVVCGAMLLSATTVTVLYELGFLASFSEGKVSVGESNAGTRHSLERERAVLEAQVEKAGAVRPMAAVDGDISAVRAHPRWLSSKACTDATAPESQELCLKYGQLAAERGASVAINVAQSRINAINAELKPYAASRVADARSHYLSRLTGGNEMDMRMIGAIAIMVFLFAGRVGAPFVFMDAKRAIAGEAEKRIAPETPGEARTAPEAIPAPTIAPKPEILPPAATYASEDEDFEEDGDHLTQEEITALWEIEEEQRHLASLKAKTVPVPAAVIEAQAQAEDGDDGDGDEDDSEPRRPDPIDLNAIARRDLVERFTKDALFFVKGDRKTFEWAKTIRAAFQHWCTVMEIEDNMAWNHFGQAFFAILTEKGATREKWSETVYVGIRIKPSFMHSMGKAAEAVEARDEEPVNGSDLPLNQRRLGSVLKDRRAIAIEAEPAGNA